MAWTDNLVEYWKLDEVSGNRSGAHAGLTLVDHGTVGSATGIVYPLMGDFVPANSEYLDLASQAAIQAGDIALTIAAWAKFRSKPAATDMGIALKAGGSNGEYLLFYKNASAQDRMRFGVYGTAGYGSEGLVEATAFGSPPLATPLLMIGWHDPTGNTVNIEINGSANQATGVTTGIYVGTDALEIGRNAGAGHFDGNIGPVMLWKRLLTTQERIDLYNGGAGLTYAAMAGTSLSLNLSEPVIFSSSF